MNKETLKKVEDSILKMESRENKFYFIVQDTKGNAKGSVMYIYRMAKTLKDNGFNVVIAHEKEDYTKVGSWMGEEYDEITHKCINKQELEISPEDFIIIPEIYGHVLEQVKSITCGKIILAQAYDYILDTVEPGASWVDYGFMKCITTNEEQKEYISGVMRNVSFDIIEPYIDDKLFKNENKPRKPIISIHTRDQRDTMKIIKTFYLKYPQFRWFTFKDMRGLTPEEFSEDLNNSFLSVWVDDISGYGTFPLESMKCGTPVIGKIPNLHPKWLTEENGIWTYNINDMVDIIADFVESWLEDAISDDLYKGMENTVEELQSEDKLNKNIVEAFTSYTEKRKENFKNQLEKIKENE